MLTNSSSVSEKLGFSFIFSFNQSPKVIVCFSPSSITTSPSLFLLVNNIVFNISRGGTSIVNVVPFFTLL